MFLAESLNQKLRTTFDNNELTNTNNCLFPYMKPKQNPKVLEIQRNRPAFTREQLHDMTNEEFFNKFTLGNLHKKWHRKFQCNYKMSTKKFSDECIPKEAKLSKLYIKDFLDRDIFESRNPRWNKSTKPDYTKTEKVPLKKTLFEVNNGFNNYLVTPLLEKKVEEGVDSRNIHHFGFDWNVSNKLEKNEKKKLEEDLYIKSMNNTQKYWRKHIEDRLNENEIPISHERRQVEEPRYYKKYKSPRNLSIYNYHYMQKAKNDLWLEKEKVLKEEEKKNFGILKEKINIIVEKRMNPKYKERFDILTGKKKEKINDNKKKIHWKDEELIEKMELVYHCTDLDWYKSKNEEKNKNEVLKQLVPNKDKIIKEQEKIREEKIIENKRRIKHEIIEQKTKAIKNKHLNPIKFSKYPIDLSTFETTRNNNLTEYDDHRKKESWNSMNSTTYHFGNYDFELDNNKLFLDAYKKVLTTNESSQKRSKTLYTYNDKKWIQFKYYHPGKYREFKYENKSKKSETFLAWSCCNNTEKDSKGCQRIKINKHRWNLDNI